MRKCGACQHRGAPSAPPSAACVVAYARTSMDGDAGILQHIAGLAASKTVPRASAYCKACRANTWLCQESSELDAAALDFWHQWQSGKRIGRSIAVMQKLLAKKRARKDTPCSP